MLPPVSSTNEDVQFARLASPTVAMTIQGLNHLSGRAEEYAALSERDGDPLDTVAELAHSIAAGWANVARRLRNDIAMRQAAACFDASRNGHGFPPLTADDDRPSARWTFKSDLLDAQDQGRKDGRP